VERLGMRSICVITGNRSEYSRLKSVMQAIKKRRDLKLTLFVTASHLLDDFGMTINNIRADGFDIDASADTIVAGENLSAMAKSVGVGVLEITTLLSQFKPDIVLIVGDRFDALSSAIAAALTNTLVAHIQGGEVTGSIDESIRHTITKLSHIHFPSTKKSAERIIKMGERPETVFNVGCPSMDILSSIKLDGLDEVYRKYDLNLNPKDKFLLIIQHPVTTEYDHVRHQIRETLEAVHASGLPAIMFYPNVDAGSKDMVREIRLFDEEKTHNKITKLKHLAFEDFITLLRHCLCVVGNSSAGIRETCFFGVPTVNIGSRQTGRERGKNIIDVEHDQVKIKAAIEKQIRAGKYEPEYIYGRGDAGEKIAEILATCDIKVQKRIAY
jgi:UDP-hydrolysing UDP-N-acetyl-D-glucosamine 2-epimerase